MNGERHLLVVDDDDRIRGLLKEYLTRHGFRVTGASDAAGARRMLDALDFDLMILDVMMPGEDGLSLARAIRAGPAPKAQTPILMLTARGLPNERIEGLASGVDDYLPKPFDPQELLLRIEAILRRSGPRQARGGQRVLMGLCGFDVARGELFKGEDGVRLTEAETNLLRRLSQTPNVPVDRLELAQGAGPIPQVLDGAGRAVDIHVTRLRRKIEADPKNPRYLQTVRGVGYMLCPDDG